MTNPKYDLILELADYTETPPESFYFGLFNADVVDGKIQLRRAPSCGTLQCMLGNAPLVFPEQWRFSSYGDPVFGDNDEPFYAAMEFFNINRKDFEFLFLPRYQESYNRPNLGLNATAKEVADNARWWVQMKREEANNG